MARTQCVYYRAPDGSEPVDEFIEGLDERTQPTIDLQIDRLNDRSPTAPPLPFPHTSQVRGQLREVRCHYGSALRGAVGRLQAQDGCAEAAAAARGRP